MQSSSHLSSAQQKVSYNEHRMQDIYVYIVRVRKGSTTPQLVVVVVNI